MRHPAEPGTAGGPETPAVPVAIVRSRSAARSAGYRAEALVVAFLRNCGAPYAERRIAGATRDRGDIAGIPGVVIEVKSPGPRRPVSLGPWLDEAMAERNNDSAAIGMLVVKRRNRGSPADWFWLTDGATMTALLRDAGWIA